MAECKCKISIEKIIHKSLESTLNKISADCEIRVNYIQVEWDYNGIGEDKTVSKLTIETETTRN